MRQIKFRAWDGRILHYSDNDFGSLEAFFALTDDKGYGAKTIYQQFTGLLDKNGREIYEGDYLNLKFPSEKDITVVCEVVFDKGSFIFRNPKVHPLDMTAFEEKDGKYDKIKPEICGNCFENPEMSSSLGYFKDLSQAVTAATNH